MGTVTRMIDHAPVAVGDHQQMGEWIKTWAEAFADGDYGEFRSVVVVLEAPDGQMGIVSQSIGAMDKARLVGLLMAAAHRKLDGQAAIQDLEVG